MLKQIFFLILIPVLVNAQTNSTTTNRISDSIKVVMLENAALIYPRIRQFSITHQEQATGNISSKLFGNDLFTGKYRVAKTTISMNIPILERQNRSLSTSLGVIHNYFYLNEIENKNSLHEVVNINKYIPMASVGVNYMQRDTIWNTPITFSAIVGGIVNPSFTRSQFTFTGLISVPLLKSPNSRLNGGLVIVADPSSPVPAFLFINYFHKFRAIDLDLMADIPYRVAVRKQTSKKSSISFSNELAGGNSFFEYQNSSPIFPQKMILSTFEIKSGFLYEYRVTQKAVLSFGIGINFTANSKTRESYSSPDDYFVKNKNAPVPYFQFGFSLLPFWGGLNL